MATQYTNQEMTEEQKLVNSALKKYKNALKSFESQRKAAGEILSKFGLSRIKAWFETMLPFGRVFNQISTEGMLDAQRKSHPLPGEEWDPERFLNVVQKSSAFVGELLSDNQNILDGAALISVAAYGGRLLFCDSSIDIVKSVLQEASWKDGAVAWYAGNATPHNYINLLSRPLLAGIDVLPFIDFETNKIESIAENLRYSQAQSFANEVDIITSKIKEITKELKSIKTFTEKLKAQTEALQSSLMQLLTETSSILDNVSPKEENSLIAIDNLSEVEKKFVMLAWIVGQELLELLVMPLLIETGTLSPESQKSLDGLPTRYNQYVSEINQLQGERTETTRLLAEAQNLILKTQDDFRNAKKQIKNNFISFGNYKVAVWNDHLKKYTSVISKFTDISIETSILGMTPLFSFNDALPSLKNVLQRIDIFQSDTYASNNEANSIAFAVDSLDKNMVGFDKLLHWINEIDSIDLRVGAYENEEFERACETVNKVSGKETLEQARDLYGYACDSCRKTNAISNELQNLEANLNKYKHTITNIVTQFQPIANRVNKLDSLYSDGTPFQMLSMQEQKIISISWEYAELLYKLLTDSFFNGNEPCLHLNEGNATIIEDRLKQIRKSMVGLKGDDAYAADSLWDKPAQRALLIGLGASALLFIIGIVTTVLGTAGGLLFVADAAIAFPIFFIQKDMPQNRLTMWRWIRIAFAGILAILIIAIL